MRFFSLLEILISISVISLVFGGIAITVPRVLREEKFNSSVEIAKGKIMLAKELALAYESDCKLHFVKKEKAMECSISSSVPIPSHIMAWINKDSFLPGIEEVVLGKKKVEMLFFDGREGTLSSIALEFKGGEKTTNVEFNEKKFAKAPYPKALLAS